MKRTVEEVAQEIHQLYLDVFTSPSGMVVLKDMARAHHYESSTFSSDALKLAFQEGERNVILRIRNLINTPPEQTTLAPKRG